MLTRNDLAVILAHHGDIYGAETVEPADIDFELADQIIEDRAQAVYMALISDPHAYVSGFRRFMWFAAYAVIVAAIAVGIILTQAGRAH